MSYAKSKPRISGNKCMAVTAKQFDKATGRRTDIKMHTLGIGQGMMVTAEAGQIVELKVLLIPTNTAGTTELRLELRATGSSLPDARSTHGTLE